VKVAVLGAGAIGAYVGASLERGGADVHLIARGEHLQALKARGVQVFSPRGDFSAHPPATDDPADIGPVDYVFLGLKAQDYAAAGNLIRPLLKDGTAVIAAQNGIPWWYFFGHGGPHDGRRVESVDPGGSVSAVIDPRRVIGCVVYSSTEVVEPGVIRHVEGTRFSIGEPDRSISGRCEAFAEAMIAGRLKCPVEAELRDDIWIKLMGNAAFNPLSVLTGGTMGAICADAQTRDVAARVMAECLAVAGALGSQPDISIDRRIAGAAKVGDHKTSMLQDFEAGKSLELAPITAAVIELAQLVGIETPTLRVLHAAAGFIDPARRPSQRAR
jgi:2-dehydropantoate 2-reductase